MTDHRAHASAAGYPVLDQPVQPDPTAARMLLRDPGAVGLAISGDVLLVAVAEVPTAARLAALEHASGMPVTVTVATRAALDAMRAAVRTGPDGADAMTSAILSAATAAGAHDVVLAVGKTPRARTGGDLVALDGFPHLAAEDVTACATWLTGTTAPGVYAATASGARWRVHVATAAGAPLVTLRRLPATPPRVEDVAAPAALVRATDATGGLVVVASPPGGGKSTTLAALVDRVNTTRAAHVVTIDHVTEYRHRDRRGTVTHLVTGVDVPDTATALAAAAPLGADVMAVEVRDAATARAALAVAAGGTLVLATVCAGTTSAALGALAAALPADERGWAWATMAATLRVATAQQLLPAAGGGQAAVFEVLTPTVDVRRILATGDGAALTRRVEDGGDGVVSMTRALALNANAGRVHPAPARHAAADPVLFDEYVAAAPATDTTREAHLPVDEPVRAGRRAQRAAEPAPAPAPAAPQVDEPMPTRASLRRRGA